MADTLSTDIARFAARLQLADIPPPTVVKCKQLILDSIGCALGARDAEPVRMVCKVMRALGGSQEATVIGTNCKLPATSATLVNGVMLRYLDFNDVDLGKGHHSDVMPCAWAVGERQRSSGKDILEAIVAGYEIQCAIVDTIDMVPAGLHPVTVGAIAAPAVAGRLLALDTAQIAHAIGLTLSTHVILHSWLSGKGDIPMIKAYAYPSAAEAGVKCALLAAQGFTAPLDVVDQFLTTFGRNVDCVPLQKLGTEYKLPRQMLKRYAAQVFTQAAIEATVDIVSRLDIVPEQVDRVLIKTPHSGVQSSAGAYDPKTREAADHSLPYTVAMAIFDRTVLPEQYAHEQWLNPLVKDLMRKIRCEKDATLNEAGERYASFSAEVTVVRKDGRSHTQHVKQPTGHPAQPMSQAALEAKFRDLADPCMGQSAQQEVIDTVMHLESLRNFGDLMELLTRAKPDRKNGAMSR